MIFSTHDMAIAEQMCDAVFMIFRGKKVLDGSLESIRNQFGDDALRVHFAKPTTLDGDLTGVLPGVIATTQLGQEYQLRLKADADLQLLLTRLMQLGPIDRFERATPTLQDIFVRLAH